MDEPRRWRRGGGWRGGVALAQLASAATEPALLLAFDAILAAASTPAAMAFSAVTSLSLRRKKEVGGAVWTERVAAAYGRMLREMKRVEASAAPSAPDPPLAPAGVGRALFMRAVSTDNADDVAGGTGVGGENKDEDSAAQPGKTLPCPVYKGGKKALIKVCIGSNVARARDLIARGINIDEQDEDGRTALILVVQFNRTEMLQELIRAGAALDVQDSSVGFNGGETALMQLSPSEASVNYFR